MTFNYVSLFFHSFMIAAYLRRLDRGSEYPRVDMGFLIVHCALIIMILTIILKEI